MDWLAGFLESFPGVRLDFVLSDASTDLIAEKIDVAFRGGALPDSGYVGRQIHSPGRNTLVASPGYLSRHGLPNGIADLSQHHCLGAAHVNGALKWRLVGPSDQAEEIRLRPRLSCNTAQSLRKATWAGIGIALLPSNMARLDLEAGRVVPVLPDYICAGHGLNVLYPSRRHLPVAVSAFIKLVIEKTHDLGPLPSIRAEAAA